MKIEMMDFDWLWSKVSTLKKLEDELVFRDEKTKVLYVQDVDSVIAMHLQCEGNA